MVASVGSSGLQLCSLRIYINLSNMHDIRLLIEANASDYPADCIQNFMQLRRCDSYMDPYIHV